jgi:hypothetical protein
MNWHFLKRYARIVFSVALLTLAFAAASPTLNALRAQLFSQGQSKLFAALCTSMGMVRIAVDGTTEPTKPQHHSIECAWCVQPGNWLALGHADSLAVPAAIGRNPAPLLAFALSPPTIIHTIAHSRGPPFIS